ncbi:MAG TPA: DHHA1 domain-containing protein [Pyrinomonadaceae bacterium]|nr:DHHA1 domain-containing protein [Pyrinomonadaceae bacterium]
MSKTERLYYIDSHLTEFEARVTSSTERVNGWTAVTLDRTAFFPTGGGQPSDMGTLGDARVVECINEGDVVLHIIQGPLLEVGATVKGHVDWPRRLDHLQQHTGQHILSQAFVKSFNAITHSVRMTDKLAEIHVALEQPSDERIEQAVEMANRIIWEDRLVSVRQVTQEEAAQLPLRHDSEREGSLRLIEIEDFDLCPCGGTHAGRTGEVGIICVRSWERAKGITRIEFVAGNRALADYNRVNQTARSIAAMFSAGRDEGPAAVARLLEENKRLARHIRSLEEVTARVEAEELLTEALELASGVRLVRHVYDGRDADSLKRVALAIIHRPLTIALLGSRDDETTRLIFARSMDAPGDMSALMREACQLLDGRGGGKPDMAQGSGRNVSKLAEALEAAAHSLLL